MTFRRRPDDRVDDSIAPRDLLLECGGRLVEREAMRGQRRQLDLPRLRKGDGPRIDLRHAA
jgi:hypothetical protein